MNYITFFITRFWVIWNIFLSIIPYGFWHIALYFKSKNLHYIYWLNILLMVLFTPNSIYLTTDIIHIFSSIPSNFYFSGGTPLELLGYIDLGSMDFGWLYNLVMIFLFSLGIFIFWNQSKLLFREFKLNFISKLIYFTVISYGVYLGRFVRLNSWDLFFDFQNFLYNLNPGLQGVVFILVFTVFEVISFLALEGFFRVLGKNQILEKLEKIQD